MYHISPLYCALSLYPASHFDKQLPSIIQESTAYIFVPDFRYLRHDIQAALYKSELSPSTALEDLVGVSTGICPSCIEILRDITRLGVLFCCMEELHDRAARGLIKPGMRSDVASAAKPRNVEESKGDSDCEVAVVIFWILARVEFSGSMP